jgi:MFS family permease
MDLALLWRHPNYLGATISQFIAGIAEMGVGLLFPLLLILNLGMSPALAGLALIPTTVPMVVVAPLAGRWYDRAGGRPPLITGFAALLAAAVILAVSVHAHTYLPLLPGFLLYGIGLGLILTAERRGAPARLQPDRARGDRRPGRAAAHPALRGPCPADHAGAMLHVPGRRGAIGRRSAAVRRGAVHPLADRVRRGRARAG